MAPREQVVRMTASSEQAERRKHTAKRKVFPHQLSRLIDNPLRRLLLSPRTLVNRLDLSETSRVLEVGPGSGYLSVELAERIPRGELVLLDLQPEMLSKARRKVESMRLHNVRYDLPPGLGEHF